MKDREEVFVYSDGHSIGVTPEDGEMLAGLGLIEPHPGAGGDGIHSRDYRLTADGSWEAITDALIARLT